MSCSSPLLWVRVNLLSTSSHEASYCQKANTHLGLSPHIQLGGVLIEQLLLDRGGHDINLIEHVTAEAYGIQQQ